MGAWDYVSTLTLNTSGYDEQLNKAVDSTKKFKEQTEQTDKSLKNLEREGGSTQKTFQSFAQQMGLSKESTLKMGTAINSATKLLGGITIAVGTAVTAFEAYKKIVTSTRASSQDFDGTMGKLTNSVNFFYESLNNGSFGSFIKNLNNVTKSAENARLALLGIQAGKQFNEIANERLRSEKAQLELRLGTEDLTIKELDEIEKRLSEIATKFENNADGLRASMNKALTSEIDAIIARVTSYEGLNNVSRGRIKSMLMDLVFNNPNKAAEYATMGRDRIRQGYISQRVVSPARQQEVEPGKIMYIPATTKTVYGSLEERELAATQFALSELSDETKGLLGDIAGVEDSLYNEARDTRNIMEKEIPVIREAIKNNNKKEGETINNLSDTLKFDRTELKSMISKLGSPTSISGISNFDRKLTEAINRLNHTQMNQLSKIMKDFEDGMTKLDQKYVSGGATEETYNREVKQLQQQMLSNIQEISHELYSLVSSTEKISNGTSTSKQMHGGLATGSWLIENTTFKSYIQNRKLQSPYYSDYSLEQLNSMLKQTEQTLKTNVNTLLSYIIEPTNNGGVGTFNLAEMLGLNETSIDDAWSRLTDVKMLQEEIYNRWKEYSAGAAGTNEYQMAENSMKSNLNLMDQALNIYAAHDDLIEAIKQKYEEADKEMRKWAETVQGLGSIFSNFGAMFDDATNKWLKFVASFLDGVSQIMPHIKTLMQLKDTKQGGKSGFNGDAIGSIVSILGSVVGIFAGAPIFSDGGVFQGKTSIGDFNLARVNSGEMILNNSQQAKLFKMLNSGNPDHKDYMAGNVKFRIQGTELVGVLDNYNKKYGRFN